MRALALALIICAFAQVAAAAGPETCSYQGELRVDGQPFEGSADFKFAILCDGTETLWSNDGTSVNGSEPTDPIILDVVGGIFSVRLGDPELAMLPVTADLLAGCAIPVLRIWVDAGAGFEQIADQPLASSPVALVSEVASRATQGFTVEGADLVVRGGNAVTVADAGDNTTAYLDGADGTVRCEVLRFGDGTSMSTAAAGGADNDWIVSGPDMSAGVPGNVGIGTTAPQTKLHLSASEDAPELRLNGDGSMLAGEAWGAVSAYYQGSTRLGRTYWKGHNSGSPTYTIDVRNRADALSIEGTAGVTGLLTPTPSLSKTLTLQGVGPNSGWLQFRTSTGSNAWHLTNEAGGLNFVETDIAAHRLLLMPGGNIGIGTNAPGARLDVNGNTVVRGDLTVQGSISTPNETRSITVGPYAFVARNSGLDFAYDPHKLVGGTAGQHLTCGYSLVLPAGATITKCELFIKDVSATNNITCGLKRVQLDSTPTTEDLVLLNSNDAPPGQAVLTTENFNHVVSDAYTYCAIVAWFTPALTDDIQFNGLRITYTMP